MYSRYISTVIRTNIYKSISRENYKYVDLIWAYFFSRSYRIKKTENSLFRAYFRVENTDSGFYFNFKKFDNNSNFINYIKQYTNSFFYYMWLGIRFWIAPIIILLSVTYFSLVLKGLPFNKVIFSWVAILMFFYWLISGFVFFFKKYQFGKYTSVVQRFWRRTYILFWMIEAGTFLVFLFFTINSSQESFYMFDQINILKTHLYSWRSFLLKLFPLILLIIFTYLFLLTIKWNIFNKNSIWLLIITMFLSYVVWLEFYQFFHVLNFYGNLNWVYDIDDHSWSLEQEPRRTRIVNHYIMLLFILKFWHIVFIYGFWIFFALRSLETKRIRYPLLAANFQNFIILYIFAWVYMYPWFKFFLRKFLDTPYYWFYINNRRLGFRVIFNDLKVIYYGLSRYYNFQNLSYLGKFVKTPFFEMKMVFSGNNYESYRKAIIKNRIIQSL